MLGQGVGGAHSGRERGETGAPGKDDAVTMRAPAPSTLPPATTACIGSCKPWAGEGEESLAGVEEEAGGGGREGVTVTLPPSGAVNGGGGEEREEGKGAFTVAATRAAPVGGRRKFPDAVTAAAGIGAGVGGRAGRESEAGAGVAAE